MLINWASESEFNPKENPLKSKLESWNNIPSFLRLSENFLNDFFKSLKSSNEINKSPTTKKIAGYIKDWLLDNYFCWGIFSLAL